MKIHPVYGHAHQDLKSAGMLDVDINWLSDNPILMIDKLKYELDNRSDKSSTLPPPYYQPCHISDINLLALHFQKVIKISYLERDILDISRIKTIKNNGYNTDFLKSMTSADNLSVLSKIHQKHFASTETTDNILNISWDMLLNDDPNILVKTLSKFTGYPEEDFNIPELQFWRKLTKDVLNQININTV